MSIVLRMLQQVVGGTRESLGLPAVDYVFTGGTLPAGVTLTRASSATRINASGLLETVGSNVARIAYDPVTLVCRGLLREPAATNLIPHSDNLSAGTWVQITGPVIGGAAPDGTGQSLDLSNPGAQIYTALTIGAGQRAEPSFWVWPISSSGLMVAVNPYTGASGTWIINLASLTPGRWNIITRDHPAVAINYEFKGDLTLGPGGTGVLFYNGSGGTMSLYLKCVQLEAGEVSTSVIPTTGSAATRAADVVSVSTGCAGVAECSIAMDFDMLALPAVNFYPLGAAITGAPCLYFYTTASGAGVYAVAAIAAKAPPLGLGRHKSAARLRSGDSLYTHNGLLPTASTTTFDLVVPPELFIYDAGTTPLSLIAERIRIWPRSMSAAELQSVTAP